MTILHAHHDLICSACYEIHISIYFIGMMYIVMSNQGIPLKDELEIFAVDTQGMSTRLSRNQVAGPFHCIIIIAQSIHRGLPIPPVKINLLIATLQNRCPLSLQIIKE